MDKSFEKVIIVLLVILVILVCIFVWSATIKPMYIQDKNIQNLAKAINTQNKILQTHQADLDLLKQGQIKREEVK